MTLALDELYEQTRRRVETIRAERDRVARTNPVMLADYLDPHYVRRAHLDVIGNAFQRVATGEVDRLLIQTPPQVGKSVSAAVWGPFWWLVNHPRHRVVLASYADSLAVTRGRSVRRLVAEHGHRYGIALDPESRSVNDWALLPGGGMRSVGVGAGLTGHSANCVDGDTGILTAAGEIAAADLAAMEDPPPLAAWNTNENRFEWRQVQATQKTEGRRLVEVHTRSGRVLRCTPDHLVYVAGDGYRPAGTLRAGDQLVTSLGSDAMPGVRHNVPTSPLDREAGSLQGGSQHLLLESLREHGTCGDVAVRALRSPIPETQMRGREGQAQRMGPHLLLGDMQAGSQHRGSEGVPHVPNVRDQHPRDRQEQRRRVLLEDLRDAVLPARRHVPTVQDDVHHAPLRVRETRTAGQNTEVLLSGMPVRQQPQDEAVPALRNSHPGQEQSVLLRHLQDRSGTRSPGGAEGAAGEGMPDMRSGLPAAELPPAVLRPRMLQCSAQHPHDRPGELELQGRPRLRQGVPARAAEDHAPRRDEVHRLRSAERVGDVHQGRHRERTDVPGGAPHQREPGGQPAREPGHAVPAVPHEAPQVDGDTVSVVLDVCGESHTVYDFQVEELHSFVAGGIVVHNCLIVDDPHKDRAEADSLRIRDNIWDWWSSTAVTRLAPSAPIVLIQTRWHRDDLAGRVLEREGRVDEGGRWHVLNMPALATSPDDPLGRAPGEPLPHPLLDPGDIAGLRAHWEDKRATMIVRDWYALCMGDPQPAEGALVDDHLMRRQTHTPPPAQPVKSAVAIDPSGGGRDTAGVVGGYLADDGRVYISHDATVHGPTEQWSEAAVHLAAELDAEMIIYESNYGGDQVRWAIRSAWEKAQRERPNDARFARVTPQLVDKRAKKGKLLRAEPIAQQLAEDRVRLAAHLPELIGEWTSWQPTDPDSPGRIDASVYLVYGLLPIPGQNTVIASPVGVDRGTITRPTGTGPRIDRGRGR